MQKQITIKKAVSLTQSGDKDAMIALLKKYQPLIGQAIGKCIAFEIMVEDLESIFTLAMIYMLQKIDLQKLK